MVEREIEKTLKCLKSDDGEEYCINEFVKYYRKYEIRHKKAIPQIPQHIGVTERMNRTHNERVKRMLSSAKMPKSFCVEALSTTCYLVIRSPSHVLKGDLPQHV